MYIAAGLLLLLVEQAVADQFFLVCIQMFKYCWIYFKPPPHTLAAAAGGIAIATKFVI